MKLCLFFKQIGVRWINAPTDILSEIDYSNVEKKMKNTFFMVLLASMVFLSGCAQQYSEDSANTESNSNAAPTERDLRSTLSELENKAYEAWKNKDGKFFDTLLAENFVEVTGAGRSDKAATIDQISGSPCIVKSFSISDENVLEIDENTALFYSKDDADFTCGDSPGPEKSYAATLFVKDGDTWKAVYHQNVISSEAKNPATALPPTASIPKQEEAATDEHSTALSNNENVLWDAFAKNDFKPFEDHLSNKFVNITPDGSQDLAALKKLLADGTCKIKSFKLSDFKVTKVSDTVSLITYKGSQEGSCGGKPVPANVWASSIWVKEGDAWKAFYHMETDVPPASAKKAEEAKPVTDA